LGGSFFVIAGGISIYVGFKLKQERTASVRFMLLHAWIFIAGFFPILVGIMSLTLNITLTNLLFTHFGSTIGGYVNAPDVMLILQVAALILIILGSINYLFGFGLLRRSERWRRAIFIYHVCWAWSILGLVFACYLSETNVRAYFFLHEGVKARQ